MKLVAELKEWIKKHNPIIGLDFDGTLVGLQPNPESVRLTAEAQAVLERLSQRFECAIITGRMLSDIQKKVPLSDFHFVGTHGTQILKKDGGFWEYENTAWARWREQRWNEFSAWVEANDARIEDKRLSLAIHYRASSRESWWEFQAGSPLNEWFGGVAQVMDGIKAWNITPKGAPHKGASAVTLCQQTGHDALVFFGDEATDENVFRLKQVKVFGVKVGEGATAASHRVSSPDEVLAVLRLLA